MAESMQLPLRNRHGWANVWGRTLYSPIMLDSHLCPKVAAPPHYVIRIPSINPESDKSLFFCFPLGFANEGTGSV